MLRVEVLKLQVHFGDCDPVGIVHYPNFFRWYDASSRYFFDRCGVPPWRELEKQHGIIGTPIVEVNSRFVSPASYGDQIEIHTSIVKWKDKIFVQTHEIRRDGILLAAAEEKRVFACRDAETGRMRAVLVPEEIVALCR
jgi:4-hydroxybenzoyl-CoA thioesterase